MTNETKRRPTILVLGATGGIGGAVASAMSQRGWTVRGLARDPAKAALRPDAEKIDWIGGDAMNRADVVAAAQGADVILHAVNPPGYRHWDKLVLPMIGNTIAAAASVGARIVLPGTIYNYDPRDTPRIDEQTPQTATSRKGQVRIALEKRLRDAAPEVRSVIIRAGDFFGPGTGSSWFAQAMIKPGKPVRRITHPGKGAPHGYAYLPDLVEALARVIERREELAPFATMQFEGFWDGDGHQLAQAIARAVGRQVPVAHFPWWLMRLLSPFGGFAREVMEVRPYWQHPMRLDNARLTALIGPEPRMPIDEAAKAALTALGSLDA